MSLFEDNNIRYVTIENITIDTTFDGIDEISDADFNLIYGIGESIQNILNSRYRIGKLFKGKSVTVKGKKRRKYTKEIFRVILMILVNHCNVTKNTMIPLVFDMDYTLVYKDGKKNSYYMTIA